MKQLPDLKKLETFYSNREYLRLTVAQLKKDFQLDEDELGSIDFTQLNYVELKEKIQPIIARMLELDTHRFFQLLYIIDVPESQVRQLILDLENAEALCLITELIIRRELQKVVIREYFKNQV